ncbi:hypothetical protein DYB37_010711 [Aphanomyces astaci]|uniref:DUF6818 domain-containing protein n=1 Tax=Aphanomyces astaci TaxID=112090 RepID=A0A418EFV1_APHAT|nr:hypothetical protein DYB35_002396 [Aphanomyces astaci]RHZ12319.1 hypothetical protein DYB37_010711 [Aphanomyces astaci]
MKRKFAQLRNHPKPTGDPLCPSEVYRAKKVSAKIDNASAVLNMEDDEDEDDQDNQELETFPPPEDVPPMRPQDQERPSRTGLDMNALASLSRQLKRPNTEVNGAGLQSYVAKKRRSLDKFIDGAADADNRASADMMSVILMIDRNTAEREERRMENERQWRFEQQQRQDKAEEDRARREERMMMMFMKFLGDKNEK